MSTATGGPGPVRLEFGGYTVDLERRGLFRGRQRVHLTSRPLEVLIFLIENQGKTVDKREILDTVWKDLFVTEDTLVHAVAEIRQALGDDRQNPRFVLTVPRHGYRFVAAVRRGESGSELATEPPRPLPVPAARTDAAGQVAAGTSSRRRRRAWLFTLAALGGIFALVTVAWLRFRDAPGLAGLAAAGREFELTRLTSGGRVVHAVLSPDGRFVVYAASHEGKESLWMRQVASASEVQIAPRSSLSYLGLAISPDGNYLYRTVWDGKGLSELQRLPVLGGAPMLLAVDVDSAAGPSPDGEWLAFVRGYPDRRETALLVVRADGSAERRLASLVFPRSFPSLASAAPAWSPSGEMIATAVSGADEDMTLVEVRVADGEMRPLTTRRWAEVRGVAWLADAGALLITAREEASSPSRIWRVSYPSGEVELVTHDPSDYLDLSAAAGSRVVSVNARALLNVWMIHPGEPTRARQLTFSNLDGVAGLSWAPDGRIVYASGASGTRDLWIVTREGSSRPLTGGPANDAWPAVSPDGRYIAFVSDRAGQKNIWRVDLDGGRPRQLTSGPCEDGPAPSASGRWVVYRDCAASRTLWKVPAEGGRPVQLTRRAAGRPAVSPDGRLIAAAIWYEKGIRTALYPFDGGEPVRILDLWCLTPHWTPDGGAVACMSWRTGVANVVSIPLKGDRTTTHTDFPSGRLEYFAWSPDGSLALARGEVQSDVVLLSDRSAR